MPKCSAITNSGASCRGVPIGGSQWCYAHHPDHTEERRRYGERGGKRGGRGRPLREMRDLKALLEDLTEQVLDGRVQTNVAAVANQLVNTRLRAIELERRIKETEELEARIEALEQTTDARKGVRSWGG
jgi:hypothetical protein